jgi:nucleoid-associated protein YgaU
MVKSVLAIVVLGVLMAGCGYKAKGYVMTKERVDLESRSVDADYETGNAGYILGSPQYKEPERKSRKVYILELTKPVAETEIKKIEEEIEATRSSISVQASESEPETQVEEKKSSRNKIIIPSFKDDNSGELTKKLPTAVHEPVAETSYVVQKDDTLQKIAKKFYGSYGDWVKIYNANKDKIKNPNVLRPNTEIIIPAAN